MITDYHANYYAHELSRVGGAGVDRLGRALFDACVDLNPHQIEAALFALRSPLSKGVLLADEVGLGKTIEAGLVLCQYWAERRRNILVITPASLRKQWALELSEKFNLPSIVLGSRYSSDRGIKELRSLLPTTDFTSPKSPLFINDILTHSTCDDDSILDYFAGSGTTGHAVIKLNREDGGNRKYILVEIGDYFDTVLKPRIAKVVYSESWKDGKPTARHTGISHCFKTIRLESYEDTLNNLRYREEAREEWERDFAKVRKGELRRNASLREDYMLHYLLEVETRGSQSLLNIDRFVDPWSYTLGVKKPGSDEQAERVVDLMETFNYLIGLRVTHISAPQWFDAAFERVEDPEVPAGQKTKLMVSGKIRKVREPSEKERGGLWCFRKVEGWTPKDPGNPNNGQREKVLVVWRNLPAYAQLRGEGEFEGLQGIEGDNLMLDEWFQKNRISTRDFEFDTIYVNGSNNLPNLKLDDENWKVRLIEEEFMKRMWNGEGI